MRSALSRSASLLALAAMLTAVPSASVRAQSFNATGTITAGFGAIDVGTPGQTTVLIDTPSAVIDWRTNEPAGSGPIIFQPLGTTATFENRGTVDFTVLNRIIPNDIKRPAQFNGTVISQLSNAATGTVTRGGTLFFYSPGGILVGPTGVFNVGNLVLSASDLTVDPATGSFGTGGTYSFLQANPDSQVQISSGAQIIAGPDGAYVALIAPKVINGGTITVDGSAVVVAADASTITFRPSGLFDIQIDQGTSATGTVVTNTGTITGPAATGAAAHRVYMVAVPKNDAITMAIQSGSTLGFDVAGAANVDGNAIVLSAGYDVVNGIVEATRSLASAPVGSDITIGAITATSQVTAQASGVASLTVQGGADATFASNVSLSGVQNPSSETNDAAYISVSGVGSTLDIAGNLTVRSLDAGAISANTPSDSTPARVSVDRGRLSVQGNLTIDASRTGFGGNDVTGGAATLVAGNAAAVDVGGSLIVNSDGVGEATGNPAQITTGSATGGIALVSVAGGATIDVAGNGGIRARGFGGEALDGPLIGGDGTGGTATIEGSIGGGSVSIGGTLDVLAGGTGADGNFCSFCGIEGGSGLGGNAGISLTSGLNLTVNQGITVDAAGRGGAATPSVGQGGGSGTGGYAFVESTGGTLVARSGLAVRAFGLGGAGALDDLGVSGSTGFGGQGGDGIGGTAAVFAGNEGGLGGGGSIAITGVTDVLAYGVGGQGGNGGGGLGGAASVSARNGSVSGAALGVFAYGTGGASASGGVAGNGSGGTADVIAYSAVEGGSAVTFAATSIDVAGRGGAGSAPILLPSAGSAGGTGLGGQAQALAEAGNGVLILGGTTLNANGIGGAGGAGGAAFAGGIGGTGGTGGNGIGGTALVGTVTGLATGATATGSASFGSVTASANGLGGLGGAGGGGSTVGAGGTGGSATGGRTALSAQDAGVTLGGDANFTADATGGGGGGGVGAGGSATVGGPGGVQLAVESASLKARALTFSAASTGGKGGTAGADTVLDTPLAVQLAGGSIDGAGLDFNASGVAAPGAAPSIIALAGGDTTLTGDFLFVTPGTVSATLDGANLRSVNVLVSASDWLQGVAPAGAAGTLFGSGTVSLLTAANLFGHFSVDSGAALNLAADGLVRLDNLTSLGAVTVTAGTTVALGNIVGGGTVSVDAPGNVTVGTVSAGGSALLTSAAALASAGITAGQKVRLEGTTSVAVAGGVQAGDSVLMVSDGAIGAGSVSAGLVSPSALPGATYGITVFGKGALTLGDLSAVHDITLFSPLAISAGVLAGREVAVLGGAAQSISSIDASGRVLLADYAMTATGGDPLGAYDLEALFVAAPIAATGPITVSGAIKAGALTARSQGSISLQAITATQTATANGAVDVGAGGALAAGAITADGNVDLVAATTLDLVSASSGGLLGLTAADAMTTGTLSGDSGVTVTGSGSVRTGAVQSATGGAALSATGNLATGAITAAGPIALSSTGGSVSTGALTSVAGGIGATSNGAMDIVSANAGNSVALTSGGALTAGDISGVNGVAVTGLAAITIGALSGGVGVAVNGSGTVNTGAIQAATGGAALAATGNLATGAITAAGPIALASTGGNVSTGALTSIGGSIAATSNGAMDIVSASAGGAVTLTSGGALTAGDISGANDITVTGLAAVTTGLLASTGGSVAAGANGDLATGGVVAADGITLASSTGAVTTGDLTATGGAISLTTKTAGTAGKIVAATGLSASTGGDLSLASARSTSGDLVISATGNLAAGDLAADGGRLLVSAGGSAVLGNVTAAGLAGSVGLRVSAGTTVAAGNATAAAGELRLVSGTALTAGDLSASGGQLTVDAGGTLLAGALSARDGISAKAAADASLGGAAVSAIGDVLIDAGGALSAKAITATAGLVRITAATSAATGDLGAATTLAINSNGALALGNLQAAKVDVQAGTSLAAGTVSATNGDATLGASGNLTTGAITASGAVSAGSSAGSVTTQAVSAGGALTLTAANDLQAGALNAGGDVVAGGSTVTLGNLRGARISLSAAGPLSFGNAIATAGDVSIGTNAAVVGGSISAAGKIALSNSTGSVTLGNLDAVSNVLLFTADGLQVGNVSAANATVELRANNGSLVAGNISAGTDAALFASGNVTAGTVAARDILLLAGGSIRTAGLTSPGGRILAASNTLAAAGGAIGEFNFDAVFAEPLVQAGGALTVTGPVSAGSFTAAVAGDASVQAITATRSILVDTGGTAQLGGVWRSPLITLTASDLVMPAGSGLNAGLTGRIAIFSRNGAGMRIGDGLDGSVVPTSGFSIDNAEWSRINSGSVSVFGRDGAGAVDILIGKLDVTGPDAGSTIDDPAGTVRFSTGPTPTGAPSGTIRIAGALKAVGFRATNALAFATGQFQIASDTGSVSVLGKGDALQGSLRIDARDIHVASTPLLGRLAADPFFAGVEPALDRETVGGSGAVLQAGALEFTVGRSFYIQRTGSGIDPLGFEEPLGGFNVRPAGASPIAVIINGTFRTATGLVSGAEAWRRFKASGVDLSGFTADSRLNGCLLSAATCGLALIKGQPDPGIAPLIDTVETPVLPDDPSDPEKREPTSESAILPPQNVLSVQPDALPGQIDEPIAGSGNPALISGSAEGARP